MDFKTLQIFKKTNGHCFYCGYYGEGMEIDHFIPRAWWFKERFRFIEEVGAEFLEEWDREDKIENLFLACKKCNRTKRDKSPEDFFGNSYRIWKRYVNANLRIGVTNCSNNAINNENIKREKLGLGGIRRFHLGGGNEYYVSECRCTTRRCRCSFDDFILPAITLKAIS